MKSEQYYRVIRKIPGVRKIAEVTIDKLLLKNVKCNNDKTKKLEDLSPNMGDKSVYIERDSAWNEKTMDISIIMPVYNTGGFLRSCLESILSQETNASFEIILIDDGSTDYETIKIIQEYEKRKYNNLVIIRNEKIGISSARNIGIDYSRGMYLMFVDSDDYLYSHAVEALYKCAVNNEADISEGAYENVDISGKRIKLFPHAEGLMEKRLTYGYVWGKLFKASLFEDKQFPKGFLFEDSIIKPLIICSAKTIVGISEVVYCYRRNKKSISYASQKNYKSLDAYYITMLIHHDRKRFLLSDDQVYYDDLLNIIRLTYRRTLCLPREYKMILFDKWCMFMEQYFSDYHTDINNMQSLEKAIKDKNYLAYDLWCKINIVQ